MQTMPGRPACLLSTVHTQFVRDSHSFHWLGVCRFTLLRCSVVWVVYTHTHTHTHIDACTEPMAVSHSLMAVCVGHTHSLTVQLCLVLFRKCWIVKCSHRCSWTAHTVKVHTHTHTTHMTAARLLTDSYQYTNDSLSIILNSYWSKTADIIKRLYYPPSRHLNVNTMLSYITCCFFILIFSVLLTISQHFTAVIDWEVIMHQLIKFCWSWSQLFLRYCDFSVFNMVSGGLKCITMLNFVEFSQSFVAVSYTHLTLPTILRV